MRLLPFFLAFLFSAFLAFSQPDAQCMQGCAVEGAVQCTGASDPGSCAVSYIQGTCCPRCGGCPAGVTNPDPCPGVAPSGAAWVWNGANCYDPFEGDLYCATAVSCNDCMNHKAFRCIWDGAACVLCTASTCSISCGGGNVVNPVNPVNPPVNPGGDNGMGVYGVDQCGKHASCKTCTPISANITLANGRYYYCGWSVSRGECLHGNATGSKDSYGRLDGISSGADWIYLTSGCTSGNNDNGPPCPAAILALVLTLAVAVQRTS